MTVWILFALTVLGPEPHQGIGVFSSSEACEAARSDVIKSFLQEGATDGSVTCTHVKVNIGKFS